MIRDLPELMEQLARKDLKDLKVKIRLCKDLKDLKEFKVLTGKLQLKVSRRGREVCPLMEAGN